MKLTLRQLGYFVAAGETGSITHASRRANISQPAISAAISQLETELGAQLFLRHHAQGLSLTPAGRELLKEAKQLLKQAEGLYSAAAALGNLPRGELNVGWFTTLAPIVMPELLQSFMAAYPEARIRTKVSHQEDLLDSLHHATVDVAVTYDLQLTPDVAFRPLASLPPHVLVGAEHPLAGRKSITLAELAPLPMVLLDLPLSREYFLSLFFSDELEPNVAWTTPHQEVVRAMVANGFGYALANVRPRAETALDGRPLRRILLAGSPRPVRVGLVSLPQPKKTGLESAFELHCQNSITSDVLPGMVSLEQPRSTKRPRSGAQKP
jgi:DNA-binding transcriptional LysR family regulator